MSLHSVHSNTITSISIIHFKQPFLQIIIDLVAPIKALCSERYDDWKLKFGLFGLNCCELTGDSQLDDYFELQRAHIVMTTPVSFGPFVM